MEAYVLALWIGMLSATMELIMIENAYIFFLLRERNFAQQ